jgi:hypothetical protein
VKPPLRTKSVGTKVSDAEYAALEARARASNLTLSEWTRAGGPFKRPLLEWGGSPRDMRRAVKTAPDAA